MVQFNLILIIYNSGLYQIFEKDFHLDFKLEAGKTIKLNQSIQLEGGGGGELVSFRLLIKLNNFGPTKFNNFDVSHKICS